jgi:triosephosphate isomerase
MRQTLIAGNWKMNGLTADLDWADALMAALPDGPGVRAAVLCPPATLISSFAARLPSWVSLGGQDCAAAASGAHTGDVAAPMLADLGCRYVIVGHSERRTDHGESDALVRAKAEAALKAGLTPIVCVGETLKERESGRAEAVVTAQLQASLPHAGPGTLVIAYEPVWAIGTGRTAGPDDAQAMHQVLRAALPAGHGDVTPILYGGSVKPENAADLLAQPDIDGALVGGASLKAGDFAAIITAGQ